MTQAATYHYLESELLAVAPFPVLDASNGQFKLQITSDKGKTKWLNITPKQFKAIEAALLSALDE